MAGSSCDTCGGHVGAWWGIYPPPHVCDCDQFKWKGVPIIPVEGLPWQNPVLIDLSKWHDCPPDFMKVLNENMREILATDEDDENPLMRAF